MNLPIYFDIGESLAETRLLVKKATNHRFRVDRTDSPHSLLITDYLGDGKTCRLYTGELDENNVIACIAQMCFEKANPEKCLDFKVDPSGTAVLKQ